MNLLNAMEPESLGISEVHLWSFPELLDQLPKSKWLVKHSPNQLEKSLLSQLLWEYRSFPEELVRARCDVLLNTDAGSVCPFKPAVTMSRDMLSFEPKEMQRYGITLNRLRLFVLKYVQSRSMSKSTGVIFLSEYAARVIQSRIGVLDNYRIIPHGIREEFFINLSPKPILEKSSEIKCIYVSNAMPYKHQWNVVEAIHALRKQGMNISLMLVGGGTGRAQERVRCAIQKADPEGAFVKQLGFLNHAKILEFISKSDIFVFASSCENLPNTLIEAMATGIPIASSSAGPMPEILKDGGVYFDPEKPSEIVTALETLILDSRLRIKIAKRAVELARQFSWRTCAIDTFSYLNEVASQ
ncbi:MAG: glycosyltransferase [Gammaproteobacteria bacterium]